MTLFSLNSIVKDVLMQKGYSMHWYIQCLVYAKNCLLELSLDDLKVINTKKIPVNSYNAAELPNDYVDYVSVNLQVGQNLRKMVETDKINPLINRDENFNPIPYNQSSVNVNEQVYYGVMYPFYWNTTLWNEFGEPTGRLFGIGAGVQDDVFSVFKERNQIQLTENITCDNIILEYVSSGMDADSATRVDPYAKSTIEHFIKYQLKANNRTYSAGEVQMEEMKYISERTILRARISDLTIEKLKRIIQKASYASPK